MSEQASGSGSAEGDDLFTRFSDLLVFLPEGRAEPGAERETAAEAREAAGAPDLTRA